MARAVCGFGTLAHIPFARMLDTLKVSPHLSVQLAKELSLVFSLLCTYLLCPYKALGVLYVFVAHQFVFGGIFCGSRSFGRF